MIRTKGDAGTGNIYQAIKHVKDLRREIDELCLMSEEDISKLSENWSVDVDVLRKIKSLRRLPVVTFAAGGVATPADAAMLMQLGMDGVFVGSGIFKSEFPEKRAKSIVTAVTNYNDSNIIASCSVHLGDPM